MRLKAPDKKRPKNRKINKREYHAKYGRSEKKDRTNGERKETTLVPMVWQRWNKKES